MKVSDLLELSGGIFSDEFWDTVYPFRADLIRKNIFDHSTTIIPIKLDKLNDYLSKCTYKGKIRTASDATERMRVSIYMAIKTAKNNIKKSHKELFKHLHKFITTGTSISYSPDSPVSWFQDR